MFHINLGLAISIIRLKAVKGIDPIKPSKVISITEGTGIINMTRIIAVIITPKHAIENPFRNFAKTWCFAGTGIIFEIQNVDPSLDMAVDAATFIPDTYNMKARPIN